jgi:hypothetical protein
MAELAVGIHKLMEKREVIKDTYFAALIGLVVFLAITGGKVLNPFDSSFIFAGGGDAVQHYVGWLFFRHEPLLQIPFGKNPAYGEAVSSTIVFTDSLPLMAFIFRPLARFLPFSFQYVGIWTAISFALQGVFAWKLLQRFTTDRILLGLGTAFFTLSFPMVLRISSHEGLSAHWLILAALWLFFSDSPKRSRWALLISLAALVHAYMIAILGIIWAFDLGRRYLSKCEQPIQLAKEVATVLVCLVVVMGLAGYFAHGSTVAEGFGIYRMNLLSWFDRKDALSTLVFQERRAGDYEGAVYLGAGMLCLAVLAIAALPRVRHNFSVSRSKMKAVIALCAALLLYAISNRVGFGSHEVLSYPLDTVVGPLAKTFRVSGRFAWPVMYLAYMAIIAVVIRCYSNRTAAVAMSVLLLVQAGDMMNGTALMRERWSQPWASPMQSAFWNDAGAKYKRVAFVLPANGPATALPAGALPLDIFAASHGMSVNWSDAARPDEVKAKALADSLREEVLSGQIRPDTLYVIGDDAVWSRAGGTGKTVDGYRIIAPGVQ